MAQKTLVETAASTLAKKGKRWKIVAATPGQGSSGFYSEEVLREYGPAALPAGSKAYINHDDKRDPRDMLGFYPEGAYYEDGVGLVTELEVFDHYAALVEAVAPHTGMSIYMMGEADEDGNVTALHPHRTNGCDLVGYPGLEGSGIVQKLYESARAASVKPAVEASAEEKEGNHMDEKDIKAVAAALAAAVAESIAPVLTFVNESKTAREAAAQAQVDAEAVETAVNEALAGYEEKVALIEAADLLEPQVEDLKRRARLGEDITKAVEHEKAVVTAAKALAESADTTVIKQSGKKHDYTIRGGRR